MTIESLIEAEAVLAKYERPIANVPYTLDTMKQLMAALDNPQDDIPVIHVAGTSGKTSTAYYCAALLKEAGYRVGLSVSPHIDSITERTQIDLKGLSEAVYCQYLGEFIDLIEQTDLEPSYFELLVAFSYWVFARKEKVDIAVVEVGLGGLLDGTNVITRPDKVCVVTDIGYDHMNVLGNTLGEIACQKAGIIHTSNQVFLHQQDQEVVDVISRVADKNRASIHVVKESTYSELPLFQQRNFSLAYAAVEYVCRRDGKTLEDTARAQALKVVIPARMEAVTMQGKTIIFDGSHNEQKIGALVTSLEQAYPDVRMTVVSAFTDHRRENAVQGLGLLHRLSDEIVVTEFENHQDSRQQSLSVDDLAMVARTAGFRSVYQETDPKRALERALQTDAGVIVVTGSFYLLRYVR